MKRKEQPIPLMIASLLLVGLLLSSDAVALSPSPAGIRVSITLNEGEVSYSLRGAPVSEQQLEDKLKHMMELDRDALVVLELPEQGVPLDAAHLLRVLGKLRHAGVRMCRCVQVQTSVSKVRDGDAVLDVKAVRVENLLTLSLQQLSPYRLEDITKRAQKSLKRQLEPEVRKAIRPNVLIEVTMRHLSKVVLLALIMGVTVGGAVAGAFISGRHATEQSHATDV